MKIPVHALKEWPVDTLNEYRAYNLVRPFTNRSERLLTGVLVELIRNQNVTKKQHYKRADELVPYLKDGVPEYLEHALVKKARKLLGFQINDWGREDVLNKIFESIQEELDKELEDRDEYLIGELRKIALDEISKMKK